MKLEMFMIFDSKVKCFNLPFALHDEVLARRAFIRAVNEPGTDIQRFPHDYSLYRLGVWDDETGLVDAHVEPVFLLNGRDCVLQEVANAS